MTVAHRSASRGLTVTAFVEWDESVKLYVGSVPGIPGAYTQGATLDELRDNLRDVLEMLADEGEVEPDELAGFVGIQQLEITVPECPHPRTLTVTAYVEWGEETRHYVGIVPGIRGAYTQGATLDELRDNLRDVLEMLADEGVLSDDDIPHFVGQLEVAV